MHTHTHTHTHAHNLPHHPSLIRQEGKIYKQETESFYPVGCVCECVPVFECVVCSNGLLSFIVMHMCERVCVCVCVRACVHVCVRVCTCTTLFRDEHVFVCAHNGGHISHEVIPIVSEQTYGLERKLTGQEVVQPRDTDTHGHTDTQAAFSEHRHPLWLSNGRLRS